MLEHESSTPEKITKEIRFAVVMYGGISLAIYMNGIAQELLSMVRATSPLEPDPEKLQGTARVYRDIANYLSTHQNNGEFDHRFIVDIISGTSAGGINGICLAKALARGLGDLKTLEQTWYSEGDIDHLLNDKGSEPKKFRSKEPKTSLFNSQRMYGKLLEAFQKMESNAKNDKSHVDYIDLFVTATDLRGIQLPIVLEEGQDEEKIYKHVFPFAYRTDPSCHIRQVNHFSGKFDSMLAFAARCTSSIPPAFEPVTIRDIKKYLEEHSPADLKQWNKNHTINSNNNWQELFFSAYVGTGNTMHLERRAFADGGYLDNRPFGHAIKSIHTREADCPVTRKLLYLDPNPEKAEERNQFTNISFIQNLTLASVSLPRYETIREEITGIRQRNDWIDSANHILKKLEYQKNLKLKKIVITHFKNFCIKNNVQEINNITNNNLIPLFYPAFIPDKNREADKISIYQNLVPSVQLFWKSISEQTISSEELESCSKNDRKNLEEMCRILGSCYTAYHFTRLDALSDEITLMIIRAMNAEKQENLTTIVNHIIRSWRRHNYLSNKKENTEKPESESIFFRNYDIRFRIRRLNLFRKEIETAIVTRLTKWLFFGLFENTYQEETHLFNMTDETKNSLTVKDALTIFYKENTDSLRALYRLRALLLSTGSQNPLHEKALKLRQAIEAMPNKNGLDKIKNDTPFDALADMFKKSGAPENKLDVKEIVDHLMESLHCLIKDGHTEPSGEDTIRYEGTIASGKRVNDALTVLGYSYPEIAGCMRYMYDYGYDLHDMTILPLLSGGEYGEGSIIDIYRMSSADATSLWDEQERNKSKLAGIALGAFGAFLDDEWRHNDIMWGRLDAAEIIINTLLPDDGDKEMREKSIRRVQFAILDETTAEWMKDLDQKRFDHKEIRAKEQFKRLESIRKAIDKQLSLSPHYDGSAPMPEWQKTFSHRYNFHRDIEPTPNLKRLGRASAILSSMIQGLDEKSGFLGKISGFLKKMSWILLGMLDFSTPKSWTAIATKYWLQLILLLSVLQICLGLLFGNFDTLKSAGKVLLRTGIILSLLDVGILLIQYNMTNILHHPQKGSGRGNWIKGILVGLSAVFLILYIIKTIFDIHAGNGTAGIMSNLSTVLCGLVRKALQGQ